MSAPLRLSLDRIFPADSGLRELARRLYVAVRDLAVTSPYGHVDPRMLLDHESFRDPCSLIGAPDHYVTRSLHASGIPLEQLEVRRGS